MKTMKTFYALLVVMCISLAASTATAVTPTSKTAFLNDSTITILADGTKSLKHTFTYNDYGKKIEDISLSWDASAGWIPISTTPPSSDMVLIYNALLQNILTYKSKYNATNKTWDKNTKSVSVFGLDGKESSSEDSIYDTTSGKYRANLHSINTYDIKGDKTSFSDKWNNSVSTTNPIIGWISPYQKSVVFSDSINGTDTLGITKKYFKTLTVTTSTYNAATSSYVDASKNDLLYQSVAVKKPLYIAEGTKIGSISSKFAAGVWTPDTKLEILGDSLTGTTLVNKYTYTNGAYVFTSKDVRYFTQRTVSILAGVNNVSAIELTLSPNPVKDQLKVSGLVESAKITILDLTGKAVITKTIANNESISLGALTPGIYIAKVTNLQGELVYRTKLIKQ